MGTRVRRAVVVGATALVGAVCLSGCTEGLDRCVNDPKLLGRAHDAREAGSLLMCTPFPFEGDGSGGGDSGGGGSGNGGSGNGGVCVPSETGAPVDDQCGIFVSSSRSYIQYDLV